MEIERTFSIAASRERVWNFLTSPEEVARCLPGCEQVETIAPGRFKVIVGFRVGPINARFNLEVQAVEAKMPEFAAYSAKGEEGGRASHISARTHLRLAEAGEDCTEVTYRSSVQVVGRLGKFAGGVMLKVAESTGDQFIARMQARFAQ